MCFRTIEQELAKPATTAGFGFSRVTDMHTGYALFDGDGRLVASNPEIFGSMGRRPRRPGGHAAIAQMFAGLKSFDGKPVERNEAFLEMAAARWRRTDGEPVEAETVDGRWKLLTVHPRANGETALVSVDITEMKRAQLAYVERAELFRCITDSHPLPVWVVDDESGEILYESLDASKLLGRKWQEHTAQYITDHYADRAAFVAMRALVGVNEIVRDHEIKLVRSDGSVAWCSTNCRRSTYGGRTCLVIGVLDITERKEREDLLGFLIRNHPLAVWMNDAATGEVIYISGMAERLLGWDENGRHTTQWLAERFVDRDQYLEISRELLANGIVENCEARLRRGDGREFWATGNLRMVEYQGRPVVLSGIADVTSQKQRDGEVVLARAMLADAIESLSEGFALFDEDRRLVMCNSLYREMNRAVAHLIEPGVEWSELLRESVRRGVYVEAIGREEEWLQERLQPDRTGFRGRYEADLGDGRWHSVAIHPTDLGGFVVTRADISESKKAEAAERKATALMQKVLDACPSPTRMSTIEGETLYRNPASRKLYGDRPRLTDYYVDPGDRETLVRVLLDKGAIDDFRVRQYDGDGRIFWGSISARLIDFQGRQVIVSNTTDITDMIVAQQQTRQANDRLIDAIESLAEGFALYDSDDCLVMANSQYRKMHAVSADVLVPGVNWFDFLRVTAERKQFRVPLDRIDEWLAERARDRREFRQQEFQHTDGGWFFVSNCPTREGGFVVTRVDITQRKRAELAAKEADELVRKVLEACPVNIQMTRATDGKLLYRSPATAALLGDAPHAVDHYVNPADRSRYVEQLFRVGWVDDFETQLWRRDGQPSWCSISARLIDFQGEKVIVSHTYDLTDRIEMQQELERQRETLHQNEKMSALGGLLAGVAHELNNPLSVVLGLSLMLKETVVDPSVADRADRICRAAERCARIVKTFLAMARQQPARSSNVAIDEVVSAAVEVAGYAIRSSDIDLVLRLQPGLPPIWADPDQLSQVLINLLVNAEQALHDWDGRRRITVSTKRRVRTGSIVIKVADTGPGIAREILPRIFEPFFTTKDVGAGTGIGLSFCHRIVQAHGGTIKVETSEAGGSTFIVSLPTSSRLEAPAQAAQPTPVASTGLACLVVDDEKEVGDMIADVLTRDGFEVTVARSGQDALAQLQKRAFSLILSDLKMPNMDGRRLFRHISDAHPDALDRLAFLTGDTISPDARSFLSATKRPYIEKPVKPVDLRAFASRIARRSA